MELHHKERTQVRRPMAPPVSLDDGRLDVGRAVQLAAFVGGALLLAAFFGWLAAAQIGPRGGSPALLFLGVAICLLSLIFGGTVGALGVLEWIDRRRRVEEWHLAALEAYQDGRGAETVEQVSEWALSIENPAHVLVAALWVHLQVQAGHDAPYSARNLRGPVFLAHRRAFELSKGGAEQMSRRFAELGLIDGRREGSAGDWTARSADEVVTRVLERW